jgi:ribosomal protein S6
MSITEDRKEALVYELGYLVLPSIAEDKLPEVVDSIKGILKKAGAKELDSEDPIHTDLSYTMSKTVGARKYVVDEAYIGWVKFEGEGQMANEIAEAVKNLDEVLRHLLIKTTKETYFTFANAIKAREEREKALEEAALEAEKGVAPEPVEKVVE